MRGWKTLVRCGKADRSPGQPEHHEPGDPQSRLHAKKKTLAAHEQKQQERAAWRAQASQLDARQLVFMDECGSNIALTPRYGWALKGQRVKGSVPRNRGKNTTLIASLCWDGMGESLISEGAANAAAFEQSGESILAPHLSAGQIVVMDSLSCQKSEKVRLAIEARGCRVLFFPGYSPDMSPIEETFSKLKAFLRRVGARTREALEEAICQALLTVTAQEARGCFSHCGYVSVEESRQGLMAQSFCYPLYGDNNNWFAASEYQELLQAVGFTQVTLHGDRPMSARKS